MILRVEVPASDAAFRSGYVARWHKKEGDEVGFGDPLCDIAIDHFMALQRTKRAALLGSTSRLRRRGVRSTYDRREGRGLVHVRLVSSEGGVRLGEIVAGEGDRIDIGDLVAILTDEPGPVPADARVRGAARRARLATDMPDAGELDPFD